MRIFYNIITIIFILFVFTTETRAQNTQYFTFLNQFKELNNSYTSIKDNNLVHINNSDTLSLNMISLGPVEESFSCLLRIANKHNIEGKIIKIKQKDGKKQRIDHTSWGLIWNYQDINNYYAIGFNGNNTIKDDIFDKRYIIVEVFQMLNGEKQLLSTHQLTNDIDIQDGLNNIQIKYDGNNTNIYIGNNTMHHISTLKIPYQDTLVAGYFIGPGAKCEIERLVLKKRPFKKNKLITSWDKNKINNYFQTAKLDFLEGFWAYLDRNIDETTTKLGGKYTLAIIKNASNGYDILYYNGAKVNEANWQCGMIKGRLIRTQFIDNYDLIWYDSMMNEYNDDTYADIEAYTILTINMPNRKAQLRFVKK